jgi:hypothetical protein
VKSLPPERRSSLETGAVLDGALSRYLRTDWGASLCWPYIAFVMKKIEGPADTHDLLVIIA